MTNKLQLSRADLEKLSREELRNLAREITEVLRVKDREHLQNLRNISDLRRAK